MPRWTPERKWEGQDAFIIGGGPSLQGFDFQRLRHHHTIGCNSAFVHGASICNYCFFSDETWFHTFERELEGFAGGVVTHCESIPFDHSWVLRMERRDYGLHTDALCFGHNSGCGAINLALLLGAKRVYLLGFDCKLSPTGRPNWHERVIDTPNPGVYPLFLEGFRSIAATLPATFPGTEILNCTPGSAIPDFPIINLDSVLA